MATGNILIDTSLIIDYFRKTKRERSRLYELIANPNLHISTITLYELYAGTTDASKRNDIDDIIGLVKILPFTREVAEEAGDIYILHCEKKTN